MLRSSRELTKVEMIALLHTQMLRAQVLYAKMLYIPLLCAQVLRAQVLYAQVLCAQMLRAQGLACMGPACRSPPRVPKPGKMCLGWEKLCSCLLRYPKPSPPSATPSAWGPARHRWLAASRLLCRKGGSRPAEEGT